MSTSESALPQKQKHLVILVHGIRTRSEWQNALRAELETAGFAVSPTNYGRFDLVRFLFPIWSFRLAAIEKVRHQIATALRTHSNPTSVSFVAHSFGTFILGHILRSALGLKPQRVILCGSILPYDFPFGEFIDDHDVIISEAGRRDFWPALAEAVTWGYGSAGTYGFNSGSVRDRFHNSLGHSDFLQPDFWRKFWIPFLKDGTVVTGDTILEKPPWYVRLSLVMAKKYVLSVIGAVVVALFWLRSDPIDVTIVRSPLGFSFVGNEVLQLVASIEHDSGSCTSSWIVDVVRQRTCMSVERVERDALASLVACAMPNSATTLRGRDPAALLRKLSEAVPCIHLEALETRRLSVSVDSTKVTSWTDSGARRYLFCGCSEEIVTLFKQKYR